MVLNQPILRIIFFFVCAAASKYVCRMKWSILNHYTSTANTKNTFLYLHILNMLLFICEQFQVVSNFSNMNAA